MTELKDRVIDAYWHLLPPSQEKGSLLYFFFLHNVSKSFMKT
jgi:hypothetical protein